MRSVALCAISLHEMAGGLEKNIVLLANHLATRGDRVCLISFDLPGAQAFYELDPSVHWHQVARTPPHTGIGFWQRMQMIGRIRHALRAAGRPIIVCFHHGVLLRLFAGAIGLHLPLVCSERNSLTLYQHIRQSKWSIGFLMLIATRRITVQFPAYVRDYPWWLRSRIRVVPNPVFGVATHADPGRCGPEGRFRLLHVGRLCAQKNQRMLIDTFAGLCGRHPRWDLHLVGDGENQDELAEHIRSHSLAGRVFLEGKRRDVSTWMATSHLFCMPSKWEGFPNALAEAMAHGLPCVGLHACAGVRDLIDDGVTGRLTDPADLASVLDTLMSAPDMRRAMGRAALDRIAQYRPEETFRRWDEVLSQVDAPR